MKRDLLVKALACGLLLSLWIWPAQASQDGDPGTHCTLGTLGPQACIRPAHFVYDTCQLIEAAGKRHNVDPGFFARLLWQESRFDPNALSHAGAAGIAQFMPRTAARRGLLDRYNPAMAIERSADLLGELIRVYGNEGLAAIGYNGGRGRADGFTKEGKGLAEETVNYVPIITGLPAEVWRDNPPAKPDFRLDPKLSFQAACHNLARKRALTALQQTAGAKAKPPPKPRRKPWGVQVGFGKTKSEARAKLKQLPRACRARVGREKVDLVPVKKRGGTGSYQMLRINRTNRDEADDLCRTLAQSGCLCRVYRNPS